MERYVRSQTACPGRGGLQRAAPVFHSGLWRRAWRSLCRTPQVEKKCPATFLLGSHYPSRLLRKEMVEQPQLLEPFGFEITEPGMIGAAAA